jgi:flagellar motor switch protein FliG
MTEGILAFPSGAPVEVAPPSPLDALSPAQKAAILVLQLGRDESARVLSKLDEAALEELSTEIARIGTVPAIISAAVAEEFQTLLDAGPAFGSHGGIDAARELLTASIGAERAGAITDRVTQNTVQLPFEFLQQLDHRQIVSFLADEHPQTIALVLAHLPAGLASLVLAGLTRELQADVAHRIAVMDRTSPELIRQVEGALERRLSSLGVRSDLSAVGGLRPLVEIINRADRSTEREILDGLEALDPALAERVRSQMFTFEDVANLDDRTIQLIVRQVQVNDLAMALKGVSESVRSRIMQNMSERAALGLSEQMDILGPVRVANVEEAQTGVVAVVRRMEEAGEIELSRGDDDAFVA